MKRCFVSALFQQGTHKVDRPGRFARLPDWDYFLFTNVTHLQTDWTVVPTQRCGHAILSSRLPKFQAHKLERTKHYDVIVYCDAYLAPRSDEGQRFEKLAELALSQGVVQDRHGERQCPYVECDVIAKVRKDTRARTNAAKQILRQSGVPRACGLWLNGRLAYSAQNPAVQRLFDALWALLQQDFMHRDQPLYMLAIHQTGVQPTEAPFKLANLFQTRGQIGTHVYVK